MKTQPRTSAPGSARASRADCGASPRSSCFSDQTDGSVSKKFATTSASSPAGEARALPGICCFTLPKLAAVLTPVLLGCETANYVPPVTPAMVSAIPSKQRVDMQILDRGRKLFVHRCIECHTLPPIWKYTREDWPQIVNDMSHQASLKPEEREAIIAYILAARPSHQPLPPR